MHDIVITLSRADGKWKGNCTRFAKKEINGLPRPIAALKIDSKESPTEALDEIRVWLNNGHKGEQE